MIEVQSARSFKISRFPFLIAMLCLAGEGLALGQSSTANGAQFDGPAELPRVYVKSALADTPAPGKVRQVKAADDLQRALDDAKCGETISLEASATFSGKFSFANKLCDNTHWIIVRSSDPDNALPPEGTRITPCYAGVASLPGRPDYHCVSAKNVMAKIIFDAKGENGPILFQSGANHYRFIGLEITRGKPEEHLRHLITTDDPASIADHLIFDRIWLHGNAGDETKGGLHLNGITYAAIVDSYVNDFHCIAGKGACTDAQAVNGGGGDLPGGPYKIVNNFLEASGENIMFGGAPGSTTPADIEIRHNHFFKPMIWMLGQPGFAAGYTGNPFIVKNLFELKNAQRVLLEGNLLENSWGGFTQTGFGIVVTPANQGGHCPLCRVTDVTMRYNKIQHVASGVMLANVTGVKNPTAAPFAGGHYSLHDLLFDDIRGKDFKGFGSFLIYSSRVPPLGDVKIDHITAFPSMALISILNTSEKIKNFTFTNSIFTAGRREISGSGGGTENCTNAKDDPATILSNCFDNPDFSHNLIIGDKGGWPKGNIVVNDPEAASFKRFADGKGGDYRLCAAKGEGNCSGPSRAAKAGSDGKDIGADLDQLEKMLVGVE